MKHLFITKCIEIHILIFSFLKNVYLKLTFSRFGKRAVEVLASIEQRWSIFLNPIATFLIRISDPCWDLRDTAGALDNRVADPGWFCPDPTFKKNPGSDLRGKKLAPTFQKKNRIRPSRKNRIRPSENRIRTRILPSYENCIRNLAWKHRIRITSEVEQAL